MTPWTSLFGAEFRVLTRYVMRSRMLYVWVAAALAWPASFIWLFGGAGSAPLRLAADLAVIPIGPILYGFLGAQLTDMVHARRAGELLGAWPRHELPRSAALLAALTGLACVSALLVNGLLAVQAAPTFWHSPGWVAYSLRDGVLEVGLVAALWLSLGFLVGQYVRGLWKPVGMVVVPAGLLIGAIAFVASGTGQGGLRPFATVVGGFEVAPLAWLNGYTSSIWGLAPYDGAFWLLAGLTAALFLFLAGFACLRAYGRRATLTAGTVVMAAVTGVLGMSAVRTVVALNVRNTYAPLAATFRRIPMAPVRILNAQAIVDVRHPGDIRASITYRLMSIRTADALQLFMNPALRIDALLVNGRRAVTRFHPNGVISVDVPIDPGHVLTVAIRWSGNPVLWAAEGGSGSPGPDTGAFAVAFVGVQGWWLPGGTWYPVLKTTGLVPWNLEFKSPANTVSATSLGIASGGSLARLAGRANNLAILGGHISGIPYHGVELLVGADEASVWVRALRGRGADPTPVARSAVDTALAHLSPPPHGFLALPVGSGNGPYGRAVSAELPEPWAQGSMDVIFAGDSAVNAVQNTAQGYGMMESLDVQLLDQVLNLWASRGLSSAPPSNPVEEELICAAEANLQGGANCGEVNALWNSIQGLSPADVARILNAARRAALRHQLTPAVAASIVVHAETRGGA